MAELSATVVGAALARAAAQPAAPAFLQKRHGIWQRRAWGDAARAIEDLALGLDAAGAPRGATLAIISGQRVEAVLAVYACQLAGLRPLLLHPGIAPGALATCCEESGAVAILAEDQEQVDKAADVLSRLPAVAHLMVIDPKGVRAYRHVHARALEDLAAAGAARGDRADALRRLGDALRPGDAALAYYSGGVCGDARLLAFPHAAVLAAHAGAAARLPLGGGARVMAQVALADPLGHFFLVAAPALSGAVACFGEGRSATPAEMREALPEVFVAPARAFERMRREAVARVERAGGLRRALYERAMRHGAASGIQRLLIGAPLVNVMGLARARWIGCAYDALSGATREFFERLGLAVHGLYTVADALGPAALLGEAADAAMTLFDHLEARIDDGGLLQLRSAGGGAWIATGDMAVRAGAGLALAGRAVDRLFPDGAAPFSAGAIERELARSTFVNQAVAVGGPATGVTALIELDEVAVRDWARARGLAFTTARSLAESADVQALAQAAVAEANRRLPAAARIRRHIVLPRPLDPGNGELTASLALRRAFVRNRYAHLLVAA
ncbi:MAG: AMP-binding protein [Burkholderiales bacterium]|nr:AMP-binding protein [Burkholderiales bacterium]